jgi:hypothetical protein
VTYRARETERGGKVKCLERFERKEKLKEQIQVNLEKMRISRVRR